MPIHKGSTQQRSGDEQVRRLLCVCVRVARTATDAARQDNSDARYGVRNGLDPAATRRVSARAREIAGNFCVI